MSLLIICFIGLNKSWILKIISKACKWGQDKFHMWAWLIGEAHWLVKLTRKWRVSRSFGEPRCFEPYGFIVTTASSLYFFYKDRIGSRKIIEVESDRWSNYLSNKSKTSTIGVKNEKNIVNLLKHVWPCDFIVGNIVFNSSFDKIK